LADLAEGLDLTQFISSVGRPGAITYSKFGKTSNLVGTRRLTPSITEWQFILPSKIIIQFNFYLLTCLLKIIEANYKVSMSKHDKIRQLVQFRQ
jgi:hypothetical protein